MKKELNYNYAFLFYDVGEKECRKYLRYVKIFSTLSKVSIQRWYDTIEVYITEGRIKKVINEDEDFICIVKLKNDSVFGEEVLGNGGEPTEKIWWYNN